MCVRACVCVLLVTFGWNVTKLLLGYITGNISSSKISEFSAETFSTVERVVVARPMISDLLLENSVGFFVCLLFFFFKIVW